MKNEDLKKMILTAVLYGSLWGLAEAVLGYVLHMLPYGISGLVMFPIGFMLMNNAYRQIQKTSVVFYIAIVAAAIKLVDLFLPFVPTLRILNPAVCILAEAAMVAVLFKLFVSAKRTDNLLGAVFASMAWRAFFVLFMVFLTLFSIPSGTLDGGWSSIASFIVVEGLINAAIIYGYLRIQKAEKVPSFFGKLALKPLTSLIVLTIAVAATLGFAML
jgi:hypothetical protein